MTLGKFDKSHGDRDLGFKPMFSKNVSYVVVISFIGQGNWSNQRMSPTWHKSLTNNAV